MHGIHSTWLGTASKDPFLLGWLKKGIKTGKLNLSGEKVQKEKSIIHYFSQRSAPSYPRQHQRLPCARDRAFGVVLDRASACLLFRRQLARLGCRPDTLLTERHGLAGCRLPKLSVVRFTSLATWYAVCGKSPARTSERAAAAAGGRTATSHGAL